MPPTESPELIFQTREDSSQPGGWKQSLLSHCHHPQSFPCVMPKRTTVKQFVRGEQTLRRGSACGMIIEERSPGLRQRGLGDANLGRGSATGTGRPSRPRGPLRGLSLAHCSSWIWERGRTRASCSRFWPRLLWWALTCTYIWQVIILGTYWYFLYQFW